MWKFNCARFEDIGILAYGQPSICRKPASERFVRAGADLGNLGQAELRNDDYLCSYTVHIVSSIIKAGIIAHGIFLGCCSDLLGLVSTYFCNTTTTYGVVTN